MSDFLSVRLQNVLHRRQSGLHEIINIVYEDALYRQVKGILVVELNSGQMIEDVMLAVKCQIPVEHFGRLGGIVPDPDEVIEALKEKIIK